MMHGVIGGGRHRWQGNLDPFGPSERLRRPGGLSILEEP
jgi:hypothetical protein